MQQSLECIKALLYTTFNILSVKAAATKKTKFYSLDLEGIWVKQTSMGTFRNSTTLETFRSNDLSF